MNHLSKFLAKLMAISLFFIICVFSFVFLFKKEKVQHQKIQEIVQKTEPQEKEKLPEKIIWEESSISPSTPQPQKFHQKFKEEPKIIDRRGLIQPNTKIEQDEYGREIIGDEIVLTVRLGTEGSELEALEKTYPLVLKYYDPSLGVAHFQILPHSRFSRKELQGLMKEKASYIVSAEDNALLSANFTLPNEYTASKLWYLYNDGQEMVFPQELRIPKKQNVDIFFGHYGSLPLDANCGQLIAITDTGFDPYHPDFQNVYDLSKAKNMNCKNQDSIHISSHLSSEQSECYEPNAHINLLKDLADPLKTPRADREKTEQELIHGHVLTSIMAALRNNINGAGLCSNAKIIPILHGKLQRDENSQKVRFVFTDLDGALSIKAAIDAGAKIINASWSVKTTQQICDNNESYFAACPLVRTIKYAQSKDALLIASSGNYASNNDAIPYTPASLSPYFANVISVSASGPEGKIWSGSNYGSSSVDLLAPGQYIYGPVLSNKLLTKIPAEYNPLERQDQTSIYGGDRGGGWGDGTSASAPIVSAIAAILYSQLKTKFEASHPIEQYNYAKLVKNILTERVETSSDYCPDRAKVKYGCLNAYQALSFVNFNINTENESTVFPLEALDTSYLTTLAQTGIFGPPVGASSEGERGSTAISASGGDSGGGGGGGGCGFIDNQKNFPPFGGNWPILVLYTMAFLLLVRKKIIRNFIHILFITLLFSSCGGGGGGGGGGCGGSSGGSPVSASPSPGSTILGTGEEAQVQTTIFFTLTPPTGSPLGPITVCQYNDAETLVRFIQNILINQKSDQKELQQKLNEKTIFERAGRYLLIMVSSAPWAFIDMTGKTDIVITEEDKNKAQSLDPFITNQCMPPFTPSSKVTSSKAGQVSPAAPPSLTSEERLRIQHKAKEHLKKVEEEIKNRLFFLQALREIENFKVSEALGYVPSESPYEENRIVSAAHICKPGDTRNPLRDRSCQPEIFPFGLPITKYSDEGSLADLSIGISFRGESLKNIIKEVMQRETQKKIVYEELIGPDTPISSPLYNFLVTVGNQIGENQALSLLKNFFEENITICKVSGGEESVSCSAEIPFTASFEKFDWGSIYLNPTSNLSPNSCYALQVALIKDAEEDFLGTFCLGDMKKQSYLVYRVDRIKLDQKISTDYGINPMTNVIEHFRGKEEYQSEANPKRWSYFWPQEKTPQYFSGNRSLDLIGIPLLTNFHYDYARFEETRYKDEPHYFNQILLDDWEMGHFMLTPQPPFNPLDEGYFKNAKIRRLIQSSPPTIFESDPGIIEVAGFEFSDWTWEEATCETPPPRYLDIIAGGNNQDIGCKGCHYLEEKIPPPVGDDYFRWQSAKFKTKVKIDVHSPVTILEKSEEKYEWQGEQMISSTVKNNYLGIRATVSVTEVDIDHASTSCTEEALLRTLSPLTADQLDLMKRRNIKVEVIPPKILDDKRAALDSPDPFVQLKYGYKIPNTSEIGSW
ncbi:MAG: S8 family serine peptidase, partial [Deltaproteobacteria bacterium]|nr:S8 family serine peptidase [Deltaproteobacteria bacterium]